MSQTSTPHLLHQISRGLQALGLRRVSNLLLRLSSRSTSTQAGVALKTNRVAPQIDPHVAPASSSYFNQEEDIPRGKEIKGESAVFNILRVFSENKIESVPRDDSANEAFLESFRANCADKPGYIRFHVSVQTECILMKKEDGSLSAYIKPPFGESNLDSFLLEKGFGPFDKVDTPPHENRYFDQ